MKINEIHLGDCLELMHQIPDHSIDMVLADLPYGTTACAWDSIIDLDLLWGHYKRVIKPRGAIVLTASQPFTTDLINSARDWFRYCWYWYKNIPSGFVFAKQQPLRSIEEVCIFYQDQPVYNRQPTISRIKDRLRITGASNGRKVPSKKDGHKYANTNYPSVFGEHIAPYNVLEIPCVPRATGTIHETQKPVSLFTYLIRTYTNPGDLVLDNAAGSGTTAIAAIDTGRNWLLIEKDPEYYQVAKNRITERLKQPFLPGLGGTAHNQQLYPNCYPSSPEQLSLIDGEEAD